jgi:hypothetical protein
MRGNLKLETGNSGLVTKIDKAAVTAFCADAISELERAVRLFPKWPTELQYYSQDHIDRFLTDFRIENEMLNPSGTTIFEEEWYEFLDAAMKPGNQVAARIELVQAMAMLLRISCHLGDYVAKEVQP